VQRHLPVTDAAHQVDPLARFLAQRQLDRPGPVLILQSLPDIALHLEEAVSRHQAPDALVRAVVVVVDQVVPEPLPGLREAPGACARPELLAEGLPEPLALAQGLRVVAAGHHVVDALLDQQLLEAALPPP